MRPFHYARPARLGEVLALLEEYGTDASLLAGGTDLLVRLRTGKARPRLLVDLKKVETLRSDVVQCGGCLRIGALAVMADLIQDDRLRRHFPALVEAAGTVGSVQIRNRATLAGNICNASPAADTAPALLVYRAVANLISTAGSRRVPVSEFFTGPGRTVLGRAEIVESLELPLPAGPAGAAFVRLTRRRGVDLASVSVCCLVTPAGGVRFALGAVGPRPFLVEDQSGVWVDPQSNTPAVDDALRRVIAQASPISDVRASREYRLAMLVVLSRRALLAAADRLRMAEAEAGL